MDHSGKPTWWHKARELEQADQLEEAEKLLKDEIPHQAFALEIAEMYRDRMLRFRAASKQGKASEAKERATEWAYFYASQATSGGEGTAMSLERDDFLRTL